ncbi:hypothetical protein AOLI_G00220540 [Acnodon oligacanthus]
MPKLTELCLGVALLLSNASSSWTTKSTNFETLFTVPQWSWGGRGLAASALRITQRLTDLTFYSEETMTFFVTFRAEQVHLPLSRSRPSFEQMRRKDNCKLLAIESMSAFETSGSS